MLDAESLTDLRRFKIAGGPDDMDFAPDGKILVSRCWTQSVVDPANRTYSTMPTGRSHHGVWLNIHDDLPLATPPAAKPGT